MSLNIWYYLFHKKEKIFFSLLDTSDTVEFKDSRVRAIKTRDAIKNYGKTKMQIFERQEKEHVLTGRSNMADTR